MFISSQMNLVLILVNAAIFQIGWILSVSFGTPVAIVVSLTALLIYLLYFRKDKLDLVLISGVVLIGLIVDTFMGTLGVLVYPSGKVYPPFWMATLWLLFAMTIPWSLHWLVCKKYWFVLFSAIGGPLSYFIGVKISSVSFGFDILSSIVLLTVIWTVIGFTIYKISDRWREQCAAI
jgi:hypothetical protein